MGSGNSELGVKGYSSGDLYLRTLALCVCVCFFFCVWRDQREIKKPEKREGFVFGALEKVWFKVGLV